MLVVEADLEKVEREALLAQAVVAREEVTLLELLERLILGAVVVLVLVAPQAVQVS